MREERNKTEQKKMETMMTENEAVCEESKTEKQFLQDNRGVGVVEVILILVVLIALVLIFKEQLGAMVTKAMNALEKSMNEVIS